MFLLPATLRLKLTIKRLTRSPSATVKWCLKNVLSGKRLSGNSFVRESSVRETSVRETSCPGIVCPGNVLSGKVTVRETTAHHPVLQKSISVEESKSDIVTPHHATQQSRNIRLTKTGTICRRLMRAWRTLWNMSTSCSTFSRSSTQLSVQTRPLRVAPSLTHTISHNHDYTHVFNPLWAH